MGIATDTPGFWDRISAICAGLQQAAAAGVERITYNALDFLSGDYCRRDLAALRELTARLAGFMNKLENRDVISLDTITHCLWNPELTALQIATHFRYLEKGDRRRAWEVHRAGHFVSDRGVDRSHKTPIEETHELEQGRILAEAEAQCDQWGSIEIIRFIRKRGVARWKFCDAERASAVECLEYARLPLERRIAYSDRDLSADWLADPSHSELDGKIVPLVKGDEVLFSIEKMLADPRCATSSGSAGRRTALGAGRKSARAQRDEWMRDLVEHIKRKESEKPPSQRMRTATIYEIVAEVLSKRTGRSVSAKSVSTLYTGMRSRPRPTGTNPMSDATAAKTLTGHYPVPTRASA